METKAKTFIKPARINVSPQAQNILSHTKFTAKDLVEWRIAQGFGIGGNDAAFFLEAMAKQEAQQE